MNPSQISAIRTRLRNVNVEYSALVRNKSGEGRFVRMRELRIERAALMALLASPTIPVSNGGVRIPDQPLSTASLAMQGSRA